MDIYQYLFGKTEDADTLQMVFRGLLVFATALCLLRMGGKRTFGKGTALDNILIIILGGMFSRVIIGAAPFFPVLFSILAMILLYRLLAYLSLYEKISNVVMGRKVELYRNGSQVKDAMKRTMTSMEDLKEAMRLQTASEDFREVD